jgi:hypothetical protein
MQIVTRLTLMAFSPRSWAMQPELKLAERGECRLKNELPSCSSVLGFA